MRRTTVVAAFAVWWTLAAVDASAGPQAQAAPGRGQVLKRSGVVTDARGLPMTGNVLLDFKVVDREKARELWKESLYVSAVNGVFHAELGRLSPLPAAARDMVEISAPPGTGWGVAPLPAAPAASEPPAVERPAARAEPAAAALPAPAVAEAPAPRPTPSKPALPPPSLATPKAQADQESRTVLQLQDELQKVKAQLEAEKSASRPGVYEVQAGDTLRSIAEKLLGNPERWVDLYQANDDRLLRGGDLIPGQKLIIPRDVPGARK
ncbi:MAG: LysM peptidoglycan-binding domain-containing protein [Elusimicrobia bacterium]|nr:LysM peptidoglycan-binding domain-containing protein [Elusimicrobiota bacterium]